MDTPYTWKCLEIKCVVSDDTGSSFIFLLKKSKILIFNQYVKARQM